MNDLKTLIDLSVGTRLPHYEPVIFSDVELTEYYLHKLCGNEWWFDSGYAVPYMAYYYAMTVMMSKWPEAECIIASDPGWAHNYAWHVMGTRWPEAEAVISTDPCWAYNYAKFVMKSTWPEAEHNIAADGYFRDLYNNWFGTSI